MVPVAVLPPDVTDAVTIVTGLSALGAVFGWIGWLIGRLIFGSESDVGDWVIQGASVGGVGGLIVALVAWAA